MATINEDEELALARARAAAMRARTQAAPAPEVAPELDAARVGGLAGRAGVEGGLNAVTGLPSLVNDAVQQAASWAYKGIDKAAGLAGYEPGLAEAHERSWGGPMGTIRKMSAASERVADVLGLPKPVTKGEKIATAIGREGVSAITGVGIARPFIGAPGMAGNIAEALAANPVSQTVGGAVAGGASETAAQFTDSKTLPVVAGLVGGAVVPSSLDGRVTTGSHAGREAAAGRLLQTWAEDVGDARTNLLTAEPRTEGFRFHGSDAALDPGIASRSHRLREYANENAGGASKRLVDDNTSILSEAMTRHGAEGSGERTRRAQRGYDTQNIRDMGLDAMPEIDVTSLVRNIEGGANARNVRGNIGVAEAHQEMLGDIQQVARYNPTLRSWFIPAENLHSLRTRWSQNRYADGQKNTSALRHALGETGQYMNDIDSIMNNETGGTWGEMLQASRTGRNAADSQQFVENLRRKVTSGGREGYDPETGADYVNPGAWKRAARYSDVPLGDGTPGSKKISLEDVDPMTRSFVEGGAEDLNRGTWATKSRNGQGSATFSKSTIDRNVEDVVGQGQGPLAKLANPLLHFGGLSANAAGKYLGPIFQPVGRGLSSGGESILERTRGRATEGVKEILGRAETDPAYMADLLRRQPAYNPGIAASLAMQAARSGRGALLQGFAAGERANQREETPLTFRVRPGANARYR